MDKTELYVKMADCPPIQDMWKPEDGDFIISPDGVIVLGSDLFGVRKLKHPFPVFRFAVPTQQTVISYEVSKYQELSLKIGELEFKTIHHPIWLPTQAQIQKMMGYEKLYDMVFGLSANFWDSYRDGAAFEVPSWAKSFKYKYEGMRFTSMEQLWLGFYMHEKHSKIWNGAEWVKT